MFSTWLGRARRMDSQYCVLGSTAQGNVAKERENVAAERLMIEAIQLVQSQMDSNQNIFLAEMRAFQQRYVWFLFLSIVFWPAETLASKTRQKDRGREVLWNRSTD